jgi:ribosomal protein L32
VIDRRRRRRSRAQRERLDTHNYYDYNNCGEHFLRHTPTRAAPGGYYIIVYLSYTHTHTIGLFITTLAGYRAMDGIYLSL